MDNQPTATPTVVTQYNLRQALMSIFIGFVISALTVLFQYGIEWLKQIPAEAPGAIVGMVKYWTAWRYNHNV